MSKSELRRGIACGMLSETEFRLSRGCGRLSDRDSRDTKAASCAKMKRELGWRGRDRKWVRRHWKVLMLQNRKDLKIKAHFNEHGKIHFSKKRFQTWKGIQDKRYVKMFSLKLFKVVKRKDIIQRGNTEKKNEQTKHNAHRHRHTTRKNYIK